MRPRNPAKPGNLRARNESVVPMDRCRATWRGTSLLGLRLEAFGAIGLVPGYSTRRNRAPSRSALSQLAEVVISQLPGSPARKSARVVDSDGTYRLHNKGSYSLYKATTNPKNQRRARLRNAPSEPTASSLPMELRGSGPTNSDGPRTPDNPAAPGGHRRDQSDEQLIAQVRQAARAANTRKAYRTGWNSWARWAAEHGRPDLPAPAEDLENWLIALWRQGKRPTTLRAYRAAVAHELDGHPGPNPARSPQVREVLSGLTRKAAEQGIAPRQAAPLRWSEILRIVEVAYLPRSNQPGGRAETAEQAARRAVCDIAMICVAHDAALRCSELLALIWADIELADGSEFGTVRIRRSKTDQNGQGSFVPVSEYTSQALARLKPADARPGDRAFHFSPSTVTRRFRAAARAAGIDHANITSHSPRVGMAQDLFAAGVDMAGIMQACRWTSATMAAHYIRNLSPHHTPAAQYLKTQEPPAHVT